MEQYLLSKADFLTWVRLTHRYYQVFTPARVEQEVFFSSMSSSCELDLLTGTAVLPYLPPKDFTFPQSEVLYSFSGNGHGFEVTVPEAKPEGTVILGIRPCDTTGITWMDTFFQENIHDFYYTRRRSNLLLITIACNQPAKTCFCICCEGGPFLDPERHTFDLQLIDLKESYLVECNSDKGKALITLDQELFVPADAPSKEMRNELEQRSRTLFQPEPTSYMSAAIRQITANAISSELWTELGERCFDCGGCTFVCPCCSCFGVGYLNKGTTGCHYRFWDSCDYSGFTREVSGHNPRGEKGERFKRRFYHKLSYQYMKRDGRIGCVGCGRCITACPGEVGMPSVVARLRRGAEGRSPGRL